MASQTSDEVQAQTSPVRSSYVKTTAVVALQRQDSIQEGAGAEVAEAPPPRVTSKKPVYIDPKIVNQVQEHAAELNNLRLQHEATERELRGLRKEMIEKEKWEQSVEKKIDEMKEAGMKLRCEWIQERENIRTEITAEAFERDAERERQRHDGLLWGRDSLRRYAN